MAKKDNVEVNKSVKKDLITGFGELSKATDNSLISTYGIRRDVPGIISADVFDYSKTVLIKRDDVKAQVNSHISAYNAANDKSLEQQKRENYDNMYEIMKDDDLVKSLQSVLGTHNVKFRELLQDYEIIKRCIPQVHKVLVSLKNNIVSPDSITKSALSAKFPDSTTTADKDSINDIIKRYNLNGLLNKIVMEYLIVSVKYMSVVPYSHIAEMLSQSKSIQECASLLDAEVGGHVRTLLESSSTDSVNIIQESAASFEIEGCKDTEAPTRSDLIEADKIVRNILENIEFVDGGMAYYRNAILNEAINMTDSSEEKAMKSVYKKLTSSAKETTISNGHLTADGLLDDKEVENIKKKVEFKGCHLEELDATRVVPFRMRNTLVGYFYVDERVGLQHGDIQNSGVMEKINSTIYQRATGQDRQSIIENMVIKTISDKLMKSINAKFLTDNMDDMNVIYEFVRDNEIHKKGKRVIFFHPNDIIEFRREEGSIMKNCMFMAKLMILLTLSNTISNVTRGADRNFYYVKTGLI